MDIYPGSPAECKTLNAQVQHRFLTISAVMLYHVGSDHGAWHLERERAGRKLTTESAGQLALSDRLQGPGRISSSFCWVEFG